MLYFQAEKERMHRCKAEREHQEHQELLKAEHQKEKDALARVQARTQQALEGQRALFKDERGLRIAAEAKRD